MLAAPAQAKAPHSIWSVLGNLPSDVPHGVICGGNQVLFVSLNPSCLTPIGIGTVLSKWSNGHFFYALIRDLDGDELCFAGPVEDFSRSVNVAPAPGALGLRLTVQCMAMFSQVYPVPKGAFLVWY